MPCPIKQFSKISDYENMGIISRKQADELRHLANLMQDDVVCSALKRLKAEYDTTHKPSSEKIIKTRRSKHGQSIPTPR